MEANPEREDEATANDGGTHSVGDANANPPPPFGASNGKAAVSKSDLKDYTTELPMFDLEESINFVGEIQSQGLEKAKMPEVAKAFGYESASSTTFYRKLVAARHFGLLGNNGAELTERARDYHSPTADDSKPKALVEAVQGMQYYAEVLTQHSGKRLNIELIGNDISRKFNLSKACGKRCAKVFESSARFAGLLSLENLVQGSSPAKPGMTKDNHGDGGLSEDDDTQKHTLYLDKQKRRKFHIVAPLAVTAAELERIKNWLSFTIITEDE